MSNLTVTTHDLRTREVHSDLVQLVDLLRTQHPGDIPMPCTHSLKKPKFRHTGGEWTWSKATRQVSLAIARNSPARFGILLQRICVVDVDGEELVKDLETRFPVLRKSPCAKTPRGAHYYFLRSELADFGGFFDGPAQVKHGIDFKSVCLTGSGGFVVAAPADGRTWIRPPWALDPLGKMIPIPDSLLTAVATPRFLMFPLEFNVGTTTLAVAPSGLCRLPYITNMAEATASSSQGDGMRTRIPIPSQFSPATLLGLVQGYVQGTPVAPEFTYAGHLDKVRTQEAGKRTLELADFLGMPRRELASLDSFVQEAVANARINPILAASISGTRLVTVRSRQADKARPLALGSDGVFVAQVRRGNSVGCVPALVPEPCEALWERLPAPVKEKMIKYQSRIMVAGGFPLSCLVADDTVTSSDVDVYIVTRDVEEATRILADFRQPGCSAHLTGSTVTLTYDGGAHGATNGDTSDQALGASSNLPVQVILLLAPSHAQVLDNFDMEPCRVGAFVDDLGKLQVVSSDAWMESVLTRSFPLHTRRWSTSTVVRSLKLALKGFAPYIADLDRSHANRYVDVRRSSMLRRLGGPLNIFEPASSKVGALDLLVAEQFVAGRRDPMGSLLKSNPRRSLSGYLEVAPSRAINRIVRAAAYLGRATRVWGGASGAMAAPKRKHGDVWPNVQQMLESAVTWRAMPVFGNHRVFFPSPMGRDKVVRKARSCLQPVVSAQ